MTWPADDSLNWNTSMKAHMLVGHNADGTHDSSELNTYKIHQWTRAQTSGTGTDEIRGIGFEPRMVMFYAVRAGLPSLSTGTDNAVTARCTYQDYNDDMGTDSGNSIYLLAASGSSWVAEIDSMESDGFDVGWTISGTPGTAWVMAICFK